MNNDIMKDGTVVDIDKMYAPHDPTPAQQVMIDAYMEAHPKFSGSVLMKTVRDWYRDKHSV